MKGVLLLLLALAIWLVGGTIATMFGDYYMHQFHPDGLTYWGFIWRELLFGIPDLVVLSLQVVVYAYAMQVSPWRRTLGILMVMNGAYLLWGCVQGLEPSSSMLIHVVANVSSIIVGLVGIFIKQPAEILAEA